MENNNVNLKKIDVQEFKEELYTYYLEIFPEEERKELKMIELVCKKGYMHIIKIEESKNTVGFMILNKINDTGYAVLDYLAILPQHREKGFGTLALKELIKQENKTKGIFIEIDKIGLGKDEEENIIRVRRQKFYEQLGFKKLNYDLNLWNVIYTPYVYSNIAIEEDAIITEILKIYETISGRKRTKQNCKFIKLQAE